MSKHWRSGAFCENIYGTTWWRKGGWVDGVAPNGTLAVGHLKGVAWLDYLRQQNPFEIKAFLQPNATCPECGDMVYFYRSQYGGCAWFNEIGRPWQKHECMDVPNSKCCEAWYNDTLKDTIAIQRVQLKKKREQELHEHEAKRETELIHWQRECREIAVEKHQNYASRFFQSQKCELCDKEEFVFEFANFAVGRFYAFGDKWVVADCARNKKGEFKRNGYQDMFGADAQWKTKTPSRKRHQSRNKWFGYGAPYGDFENQKNSYEYGIDFENFYEGFLEAGQDIFASETEPSKKIYPLRVIENPRKDDNKNTYILASVISPENQVILTAGKSSSLTVGNLVFLQCTELNCRIVYLNLENGKRKYMPCKVIGLLSFANQTH